MNTSMFWLLESWKASYQVYDYSDSFVEKMLIHRLLTISNKLFAQKQIGVMAFETSSL